MIQTLRYLLARFLLIPGLLSVICIPFITANSAYAATEQTNRTLTSQSLANTSYSHAQTGSGHATIIILDISGSMATSDPNGYRCSAADAYIDLSGVNDYIGLVGLDNNNGQTTGDHNFLAAQTWMNPQQTDIKQHRDSLKQSIVQNSTLNSKFCSPDGNTPTYDSLNIALQMLNNVTNQHHVSGSVILLTDGIPCPKVDDQVTAIQNDLLPKFRDSGWPVDTIGLGQDSPIAGTAGCSDPGTLSGTFHDFLNTISHTTGGAFYDDSNGPIAGVSPLNIAPFFAEIFAKYSGKTLRKEIPPTTLNGETQERNFTVVAGTTELDVLVVADNPNMKVSLLNPQSQPITPGDEGVLVSQEQYNFIYSIANPGPGSWILSVNGSGQYLMDDFQKTDIGLVINNVKLEGSTFADPQPLPLNQPIDVNAQVTASGRLLSNSNYTLSGYVSFNNKSDDCTQAATQALTQFNLNQNGNGYMGTFTVPDTNAAGTYNILLCASTGSTQNVYASLNKAIRLELFPTPFLISPTTNQPTDSSIATTVTHWPDILSWVYSLPWTSWLSGWPLQGTSAQGQTSVQVEMQLKGQPYSDATVLSPATITYADGKTTMGTVTSQGQGNFLVQFQPPSNGHYSIAFQTSGNYKDSHGEFGPPTTRFVDVTIQNAPFDWVLWACIKSLIYLAILAFLVLLVHFWLTPHPAGEWIRNPGTDSSVKRSFARARRDPLRWFVQPNILRSAQAGMPAGLKLRFRWGGRIEVQPENTSKSMNWKTNSRGQLPQRYQQAQQLIYVTKSDQDTEIADRYVMNTSARRSQRNNRRRSGVRPTTSARARSTSTRHTSVRRR